MSKHKKSSGEKKKFKGQKEFYALILPKYFGELEVGYTPANSPEAVIGRTFEITLTDITNDFSVMHIKLKFKVEEVVGDKAYTKFVGCDLTRDYLRSLVRRSTTRVDGIFNITTKDGYTLRVTALVFTENRIAHRQKYTIRKIMKEILEEEAKNSEFPEFAQKLVYGTIADKIYKKARKIVPIRKTEILKCKLLSESAVQKAAA